MSLVAYLLALGAVARITRLLTADYLLEPLRERVETWVGLESPIAYLIRCAWCTSMWVAIVVVPLALLIGDSYWFMIPAAILTTSHIAALAQPHIYGQDD